eukprot:14352638-Heterocapsa_arctica.AAC.1
MAEFPVFEHMMGFSVFNLAVPSEASEQVYHSVPPSLPKRAFVAKRPQAGTACDYCSACRPRACRTLWARRRGRRMCSGWHSCWT